MSIITRHHVKEALRAIGYDGGVGEAQRQRARDFRAVQKGTNFMTPEGVGFYRVRSNPYLVVEVALGEFMGETLIGVTVVDRTKRESLHDVSCAVHSVEELQAKMKELEA